MLLSIIILTKTPALVRRCVCAILENTRLRDYEIVIQNNSGEPLTGLVDDRTVIDNGPCTSFAGGNNRMTERARGKHLVFINDDVIIKDGAIDRMVWMLDKDSSIGVVGARLLYENETIQHCGVVFWRDDPTHLFWHCPQTAYFDKDREYQAVTGALMACRADDFKAAGGFDEKYVWCFEDIAFCLTVRYKLNKHVVYCAKAIAYHLESQTRKNSIIPMIFTYRKEWGGKVINDKRKYEENADHFIYGNKAPSLSCVCCCNNEEVLHNGLMKTRQFSLIEAVITCGPSAATTLNEGAGKAHGDIIIFAHQDVILPSDFAVSLCEKIAQHPDFGVIGVAGRTADGKPYGTCILENGQPYSQFKEGEVLTLDECLLVIRKDSGLRFDEDFDGFHCYGADLCLQAADKGLKNYALDLDVKHMGKGGTTPGYWRAMGLLKEKWGERFEKIYLTHGEITAKEIKTLI